MLPKISNPSPWYEKKVGEHYRLLAEVCAGKNLVFDVGTYQGYSAAAMSTAKKVVSYDVANHRLVKEDELPNVEFRIGDILNDIRAKDADVILLDTFHDGSFERKFYYHLKNIGFKGLLIVDDIYYNKAMKDFWQIMEYRKVDMTLVGHHTGTGFVYFNEPL